MYSNILVCDIWEIILVTNDNTGSVVTILLFCLQSTSILTSIFVIKVYKFFITAQHYNIGSALFVHKNRGYDNGGNNNDL